MCPQSRPETCVTTHVYPALVAPRDSLDMACKYYYLVISVKLVEHLRSQIKARFGEEQRTALQGLCLILAVLVTVPLDTAKDKVVSFATNYKEDLDNLSSFQSELHSWRMKWEQQLSQSGSQSLPATANAAIQEASCMFPNIWVLLKILCTMPITSSSAERCFSALKGIKTPVHSTMANERLTDLAPAAHSPGRTS